MDEEVKQFIDKSQWLELPYEKRMILRVVFNVGRSEASEVYDNRVVSDGTSQDDLANALNIKTMKTMLDVKAAGMSCDKLWELVVNADFSDKVVLATGLGGEVWAEIAPEKPKAIKDIDKPKELDIETVTPIVLGSAKKPGRPKKKNG